MLSKYNIPKAGSLFVHKAEQKLSQVAPPHLHPSNKNMIYDTARLAKI
jgi:hypothetical protein